MINQQIKLIKLKHIKIEFINQEYIATLTDLKGFEIIKGYGLSTIDAINDLHKKLIMIFLEYLKICYYWNVYI